MKEVGHDSQGSLQWRSTPPAKHMTEKNVQVSFPLERVTDLASSLVREYAYAKKNKRALKIPEAAEILGVSENTINNWIRSNVLKEGRHFIQQKGVIRFHPDLLDRFFDDNDPYKKHQPRQLPEKPGKSMPILSKKRNSESCIDLSYS